MNNFVYVLLVTSCYILFGSVAAYAQIGESLSLGETCSYFGEQLPEDVTTFSSNREAERIINEIVETSGLVGNFKIRAAGVPNAAAIIQNGKRYILYNPNFIREISLSVDSEWAATSILAHEIGHHLNGHTLDKRGSRPGIELEADYFSGHVLQKLGAELRDAQAAMDELGEPAGSKTHPAKHDRLTAIASGWEASCDKDVECDKAVSPSRPTRRSPRPTPDLPIPSRPTYPAARYCVTTFGTCMMGMQVPVGSNCYCPSLYGPVWGVAQ